MPDDELKPLQPEPPRVKEGSLSELKFAMICLIVIAAIASFAIYRFKEISRQVAGRNRTTAVNNLRQIAISLYEFDVEYGSFPDSTTGSAVKKATGSTLKLSDHTSNDVFVQLLASGICTSESVFSTLSEATRKPDGDWSSDATALAHGETGFAVIMERSMTGSLLNNPSRPLLFGPVIPGTRTLDVNAFGGMAIILKSDFSVTSAAIDSAGRIILGGRDMLDPDNPIWAGKAPDVKWPK